MGQFGRFFGLLVLSSAMTQARRQTHVIDAKRQPSSSSSSSSSSSQEALLRVCVDAAERCSLFEGWSCVASSDCEGELAAQRADVMLSRSDGAVQDPQHFVSLATLRPSVAVAVVASDRSDAPRSLDALRGRTACHSAYADASWAASLAALKQRGLLGDEEHHLHHQSEALHTPANHDQLVPNDIESALGFFGSSCAPGRGSSSSSSSSSSSNSRTVTNYKDGICDACGGSCRADDAAAEPFSGDSGALQCLASGNDVAFVDASSLGAFSAAPSSPKSLALLCADGSSLPLPKEGADRDQAVESCNLGGIPSESIVALKSASRARQWLWRRQLAGSAAAAAKAGGGGGGGGDDDLARASFWSGLAVSQPSTTDAAPATGPFEYYRAVMRSFASLPYTIGVSERLPRKCTLPVCAKMAQAAKAAVDSW